MPKNHLGIPQKSMIPGNGVTSLCGRYSSVNNLKKDERFITCEVCNKMIETRRKRKRDRELRANGRFTETSD